MSFTTLSLRHSFIRSLFCQNISATTRFEQAAFIGQRYQAHHSIRHKTYGSNFQAIRCMATDTNTASNATSKPKKKKVNKQELHDLTAKMTSTPSRLFKLVLPIPALKEDGKAASDEKGDEYKTNSQLDRYSAPSDQHPKHLAILVHPNQPLSHLAHLIQSQLPTLSSGRVPTVSFYRPVDTPPPKDEVVIPAGDDIMRIGKEGSGLEDPPQQPKSVQGIAEDEESLVLWSGSTEIGDFIRDAAASDAEEKEGLEGGFVIDIEGTIDKSGVWVTVPSFNDRTLFIRKRYARVAKEIEAQVGIKEECDRLAHRSAQRAAITGFCGLVSWWVAVYFLTFKTNYGWDVMEPVTYLAGLSTIMIGYLWFLYNNREVSYRSVLHATISRRQVALYKEKGFDLDRWQDLLDEGRQIRREIQDVASEYGVRWSGKDENGDDGLMTQEDRKLKGKVEKVLEKEEAKEEQKEGKKKEKEAEKKDPEGQKED